MLVLITDLESQWKLYFGPKTQRRYTKDTHWKEKEIIRLTVAEKPTETQTLKDEDLEKIIDKYSTGN